MFTLEPLPRSLFEIRLGMNIKTTLGLPDCPIIGSPADVFEGFGKAMAALDREVLVSVALDCKLRLIRWRLLNVGSRHGVGIRMGDVFQAAVESGAMGIILAHNHPSGSLEPSDDDHALTRKAMKAGRLLNYMVFDHVIIAGSGFKSIMPQREDKVVSLAAYQASKAAESGTPKTDKDGQRITNGYCGDPEQKRPGFAGEASASNGKKAPCDYAKRMIINRIYGRTQCRIARRQVNRLSREVTRYKSLDKKHAIGRALLAPYLKSLQKEVSLLLAEIRRFENNGHDKSSKPCGRALPWASANQPA